MNDSSQADHDLSGPASDQASPRAAMTTPGEGSVPWYQNVRRWAQINISLKDVAAYDVEFWRQMWRRTESQAVITNGVAGFACFRSRNPLIPSSPFAPDRDLLGEITAAAREEGMFVVVRMDSGVLHPDVRDAYQDWLTRDPLGRPRNRMCVNSPFREVHVYSIYREIVERYGVDGFSDNGGVNLSPLCHCDFCKAKFGVEVGGELPQDEDFSDPRYRRWMRWNIATTMAAWEETNAYTRSVGGADCAYMGLVRKFGLLNKEIASRADILLMDCQSRNDSGSFQEHVDDGRYMRSLVGWNKTVAVCSSMTHHSHGYFRFAADPPAEAGMYFKSGLAGGFAPWWHYPVASSTDSRAYSVPEPILRWYSTHQSELVDGRPVVSAAIVYSDDNALFFGRDAPPLYQPGMISEVTQVPYRGMSRALAYQGVPYMPIHVKDISLHEMDVNVLVLPNLGGLSQEECRAIREYVRQGGSILATGMTSLFDEDGEPRDDFALGDLFGVSRAAGVSERRLFSDTSRETYLRLPSGPRHSVLNGFEETDMVALGGTVLEVAVDGGRDVVAESFVSDASRSAPAIILGTFGDGRVAYLPTDLERRFLRDGNVDHSLLLANIVRWCAGQDDPFTVAAPGMVNGYLYRQGPRLVLHLLNMSGIDNGEEMIGSTFPVGPVIVRIRQATDIAATARTLCREGDVPVRIEGESLMIEVPVVDDYEVVVVG